MRISYRSFSVRDTKTRTIHAPVFRDRVVHHLAWRQKVVAFHGYESSVGETREPLPRDPRRLLEQFGQELPLGDPQQMGARQPQQESGLPSLFGSRHEDGEQTRASPDVASSRPAPADGRDKTSGKPLAGVEICCGQRPEHTAENTSVEAPRGSSETN